MPGNIQLMLALPFDHVADQVHTVLQGQHPSAMYHRRSQPLIPVVTSDHQVEIFALRPLLGFGFGQPLPGKRRSGLGLVRIIYPESIVHFGAAEAVAIVPVADVLIRARILQERATVALQAHIQSVGMAVSAALGSLRTSMEHELRWRLGRREQVESGRGQGRRVHAGSSRFQMVPPLCSCNSQKPDGFLPQIGRDKLVVAALEKNGSRRQRIQETIVAITAGIEEPAAIIIPKPWRRPGPAEQTQGREHLSQRALQAGRDGNVIERRENGGVQNKIERVYVIISRLLEVKYARLYMQFRLSDHDLL